MKLLNIGVYGKPIDIVVRPMLKESPPRSVQQKVESEMSLPCAAGGSPQPTVQWYRNADLVTNTDRSVPHVISCICVSVHHTVCVCVCVCMYLGM